MRRTVIEHHLDVIQTADQVIGPGPEGGHAGGDIAICNASFAARLRASG